MSVLNGKRIIRIKSTKAARKYGHWYKDLLGTELEAFSYSICEAEYTVIYRGGLKILPDEDVELVSDTSTNRGLI
jgi:hypothetical protein